MREFIAVAFNELIAIDLDTGCLHPHVEMIVISSEPKWTVDAGGLRTDRIVDECRMTLTAAALRKLSEAATKQADALDALGVTVADIRHDPRSTTPPHD